MSKNIYKTIFNLIKINRFAHNWYNLMKQFYMWGSTFFSYIKCYYWNIKIDKKCRFIGVPILKKKPDSMIKIGKYCKFNSSSKGNLIGINHPCILTTLSSTAEIIIENKCGFSGVTIASNKRIIIKSKSRIGANVIITDTDWHEDDKRADISKEVILEENVWIGVNAIILKGVRIGKNSFIGANSVVTKSVPANVVAAGNPCKVIKKIDFKNPN